jgi:hypothetical protein
MYWASERTTALYTCMTVNDDGAVRHPEEPVVPVLFQVKLTYNILR